MMTVKLYVWLVLLGELILSALLDSDVNYLTGK